jgi:hypothetical protein
MKYYWNRITQVVVLVILVLVIGFTVFLTKKTAKKEVVSNPVSNLPECQTETATGCQKSDASISQINNGTAACKGSGPAKLTASPIALGDISLIQPMGLAIGGHVTPIDHGYIYIKGAMGSPPRLAAVYAPLDGVVTQISRTVRNEGSGATHPATYDDDAITIEATCTFRVRFSNLVSFDGVLKEQASDLKANDQKKINLTVKAGDLVGYTGLPTAYGIDVWVENDQSTLTGFVNPAQYQSAEPWKMHVVDLFEYTAEPLKGQLLALTMRDAEPRWGKIDHDQDGKLVGTWFKSGTGGYAGLQNSQEGYWAGHLSIIPDGNDPTQTDVSFGSYKGQAQQFAVIGNQPDPATVDQSSGVIKYQLGQLEYYSGDTGKIWDRKSYLPHIKTKANPSVQGTVLLQLTGPRQLKMEVFPGKTATQVGGFDDQALSYER